MIPHTQKWRILILWKYIRGLSDHVVSGPYNHLNSLTLNSNSVPKSYLAALGESDPRLNYKDNWANVTCHLYDPLRLTAHIAGSQNPLILWAW